MIDLSPLQQEIIINILQKHVPDCDVWAFGSRVTWTAKDYSDLDLAVVGKKKLANKTLHALQEDFEESDLPFRVDVLDWHAISPEFQKVIKSGYEVLKKKQSPNISHEWKTYKLSDIMEIVGGGTPKTTIPEYWDGNIPWLSVTDFNTGRKHVFDTEKTISEKGLQESSTRLLKKGEIIISARGTVGALTVLGRDMAFNQSCYGLKAKEEYTFEDYLYYLLKNNVSSLLNNTHGAVFDTITRETFNHISVELPPLPEQKSIASILSSLDDKIELNRKMNETLEAMARAIFKSWFVDFDPVRAKSEGRPTGLPEEMDALFPDSFEDSELGKIPKGWSVRTVGDLADVVGGSTPSTKETVFWNEGRHHWATPKDLSGLAAPVLLDTERRITNAGLAQINSGLLPAGTILLSSRAPIGYLAVAEVPVAINQGFIAIKPKKGVSNLFLLLWVSFANDDILSRANGSTFLEISKANFRPITLVAPKPMVMEAFDQQVCHLYKRIVGGERESRTLAAIRDALLPKLMSGEIKILDNICIANFP